MADSEDRFEVTNLIAFDELKRQVYRWLQKLIDPCHNFTDERLLKAYRTYYLTKHSYLHAYISTHEQMNWTSAGRRKLARHHWSKICKR
jgi:hypothetical protein